MFFSDPTSVFAKHESSERVTAVITGLPSRWVPYGVATSLDGKQRFTVKSTDFRNLKLEKGQKISLEVTTTIETTYSGENVQIFEQARLGNEGLPDYF